MTKKIEHGDDFPYSDDPSALGDMNRCQICGRRLGEKSFAVEIVDGGAVHDPATGAADTNRPGYMGAAPVGSECAKKFASGIAKRLI